MKTALGFTTGLLSGVFIGIGWVALVLLESEETRECIDKIARS